SRRNIGVLPDFNIAKDDFVSCPLRRKAFDPAVGDFPQPDRAAGLETPHNRHRPAWPGPHIVRAQLRQKEFEMQAASYRKHPSRHLRIEPMEEDLFLATFR